MHLLCLMIGIPTALTAALALYEGHYMYFIGGSFLVLLDFYMYFSYEDEKDQ